jgi:type VI protein secretion system component VasF
MAMRRRRRRERGLRGREVTCFALLCILLLHLGAFIGHSASLAREIHSLAHDSACSDI